MILSTLQYLLPFLTTSVVVTLFSLVFFISSRQLHSYIHSNSNLSSCNFSTCVSPSSLLISHDSFFSIMVNFCSISHLVASPSLQTLYIFSLPVNSSHDSQAAAGSQLRQCVECGPQSLHNSGLATWVHIVCRTCQVLPFRGQDKGHDSSTHQLIASWSWSGSSKCSLKKYPKLQPWEKFHHYS